MQAIVQYDRKIQELFDKNASGFKSNKADPVKPNETVKPQI
jgi:hypothetical protein